MKERVAFYVWFYSWLFMLYKNFKDLYFFIC